MKAFVMSLVALVAITAVAAFALESMELSAEQTFTSTSGNVRH